MPRLVQAVTEEEIDARAAVQWHIWGNGIDQASYVKRDVELRASAPFVCASRRSWFWVDDAYCGVHQSDLVLASLETHLMPATVLVSTAGADSTERGVVFGIASVLVEEQHRKRGYASALILAVLDWMRSDPLCFGSVLYSDVDPRIYTKLGFALISEAKDLVLALQPLDAAALRHTSTGPVTVPHVPASALRHDELRCCSLHCVSPVASDGDSLSVIVEGTPILVHLERVAPGLSSGTPTNIEHTRKSVCREKVVTTDSDRAIAAERDVAVTPINPAQLSLLMIYGESQYNCLATRPEPLTHCGASVRDASGSAAASITWTYHWQHDIFELSVQYIDAPHDADPRTVAALLLAAAWVARAHGMTGVRAWHMAGTWMEGDAVARLCHSPRVGSVDACETVSTAIHGRIEARDGSIPMMCPFRPTIGSWLPVQRALWL